MGCRFLTHEVSTFAPTDDASCARQLSIGCRRSAWLFSFSAPKMNSTIYRSLEMAMLVSETRAHYCRRD